MRGYLLTDSFFLESINIEKAWCGVRRSFTSTVNSVGCAYHLGDIDVIPSQLLEYIIIDTRIDAVLGRQLHRNGRKVRSFWQTMVSSANISSTVALKDVPTTMVVSLTPCEKVQKTSLPIVLILSKSLICLVSNDLS